MYALTRSISIDKPVWEVYEILTTLGGLRSWLTRDVSGTTKKGGTIVLGFGDGHSTTFEVLAATKNKKFTLSLTDSTLPEGDTGRGTKVLFTLSESSMRSTTLDLSHTGWDAENSFYKLCGFQWQESLESFKSECETGAGKPLTPALLLSKKATGWFPTS